MPDFVHDQPGARHVAPTDARARAYRYELCGLRVESDRRLPELRSLAFDDEADLRIVVRRRSASRELGRQLPGTSYVRALSREAVSMTLPAIGGLRMRPGQIEVFLSSTRAWPKARLYTLGTGFGVAMYQLGYVPHHVSAVAVGGSVVAFTGPSGAGKSTFAYSWMRSHGARFVSDDVARIDLGPASGAVIHPGLIRVKLWRDAVEQFGLSRQQLANDGGRTDKYKVHGLDAMTGPMPLHALVVLDNSGRTGETEIVRVTARDRLAQWGQSLYRPEFAGVSYGSSELMAHVLRLAERVPVYRLTRSRSFATIDADAMLVKRRLQEDGCISDAPT